MYKLQRRIEFILPCLHQVVRRNLLHIPRCSDGFDLNLEKADETHRLDMYLSTRTEEAYTPGTCQRRNIPLCAWRHP